MKKKQKKIVGGTLNNCMHSMASIVYSLKCERFVSVLRDLVLFLKILYGSDENGNKKRRDNG